MAHILEWLGARYLAAEAHYFEESKRHRWGMGAHGACVAYLEAQAAYRAAAREAFPNDYR